MKSTKEIKAEFEQFIHSIQSNLDILKNRLQITSLTYDLAEIDKVESWYKKYHRKPKKVGLTKDEIDLICTTYLGTAFMWHFGGHWELETSKLGNYGEFQVVEYGGEGYHWVELIPKNWLYFIETKQAEDRIAEIFERDINYFKIKDEFNPIPVRNYN